LHNKTTALLCPIAPSTDYIMRLQSFYTPYNPFSLQCVFTVNGVSQTFTYADTYDPPGSNGNPYNMPSAAATGSNGYTTLSPLIAVVTKTAAARKLNFRRMCMQTS
jgi:hypothetical protein